jgi:hypothetical protein
MEPKYYIPELSEFYVGFEFEFFNKEKWKVSEDFSYLFLKDDTDTVSEVNENIKEGKIRVKFLDRQDIEELGWKYSSIAQKYGIVTEEDEKTGSLGIWLSKEGYRYRITDCKAYLHMDVFNGYIKNKSDLRKLMKMLNITNK